VDFTALTVELLKILSNIAGNYGFGIILLTVIVRLALWPLGVSQQKSMRKMQKLSPKLKEIQERYKSDPQTMQRKMMEFYKEHKFNPFGGCFPLLLQLPIFFLLYGALISPQFIEVAGNSSFLFINRLDAPIRSHAGVVGDHIFGVEKNDTFSTSETATVYTQNGIIKNVKINNPKNAIQKQGELKPGNPLDLKMKIDDLDLTFEQLNSIQKINVSVINNNTKEVEHIDFVKTGSLLVAQVKTEEVKTVFHPDVFALVLLFGLTMFLSQKYMMSMNSGTVVDPAQQEMQKQMSNIMPIMITSTFFFIPIPAGVLLYMVVSNIIQVFQTIIINKQIEKEEALEKQQIQQKIEQNLPKDAKQITPKSVSDVDNKDNNSDKNKKSKKIKW